MSIEEEKGLVKGKSVIIRRNRLSLVFRQRLSDNNGEADYTESDENGSERPLEGVAAAYYAP